MLFGLIFVALKLVFLEQHFSRLAWLTLINTIALASDTIIEMTVKVGNGITYDLP